MWNRLLFVCVAELALVACSGDARDGNNLTGSPVAGTSTSATGGAGTSVATAGVASPPVGVAGGAGVGQATAGAPPAQPSAGTMAAAGRPAADGGSSGSATAGAAGMPTNAAAGAAGGPTMPVDPAAPAVPKIPEPKGDCPMFTNGTMMIAGLRTQIQAGTPKETKGALLFAWHATAGTAGAAMAGVPAAVRSEITMAGGIVVAPQGNVGGSGRTDIAPPTGAWFIQDLDFADQVVACAVKNHNIDPNRIHATGCSAGGLMSGTFGLMRSQYVASVLPNSGGINFMNSRMLSDKAHGPAALLMHGGSGDNVIVNFGETSMWFGEQNKLAGNKPYMLDCNHSRGHCGAPTSLHTLGWEFMKAHPYNVGASPWAMSPPMNLPDYCKVVQ